METNREPRSSGRDRRVESRDRRAGLALDPRPSPRGVAGQTPRGETLDPTRLLIVDGHAYAYRAFYAIRELRSPAGAPTNAIFGFVKMLARMRAALSPTHLMVVWDGGLDAGRLAALPAYKAQRPEMPADLGAQLDGIVRYLAAAGVASFCRDGVEADDYIACLARRAAGAGWEVVIASADKDFMQLVTEDDGAQRVERALDPRPSTRGVAGQTPRGEIRQVGHIGLLNPNDPTETVWTAEQVRHKAGVGPSRIVDWLALVGDSVDNIPGVPGVGPKTAAAWLNQFGSVTALYQRLAEVKSEKLRAALVAAADVVRRNVNLVRLKDDLPCEFSAAALALDPRPSTLDSTILAELFSGWGFRRLAHELNENREQPAATVREHGGQADLFAPTSDVGVCRLRPGRA